MLNMLTIASFTVLVLLLISYGSSVHMCELFTYKLVYTGIQACEVYIGLCFVVLVFWM